MPVVQSTYTATMRPGLEGMFASEWGSALVSETRNCETVAGIGFGRGVSQGSAADGCIIGGTAAGFLGVSLRDMTLDAINAAAVDLYLQKTNVGIMNAGDIWVVAVNGCAAGAVAAFSGTTGQWEPAAAGIPIPHSRWLTTATAGNLAILRLTAANP